MDTIISYNGRTTTLSDNLFEAPVVKSKNPKVSHKFGSKSLYYDGKYYFLNDLKPSQVVQGKPFEIQVVYYQGKWYQDTFYITQELKELLEKFW